MARPGGPRLAGRLPLLAPEEKTDPAATREYAVAAGLQSKKLFALAARRWQQFIDTYPGDGRLANAYHHLGSCQLHDNQPAKAAQTFRSLIQKFPKFSALDTSYFNLGLALYNVSLASAKAEDFKTAARAFAEVPARFAKSKQAGAALYYQGECLYRANDLQGAIDLYRKVTTDHPGSDMAPDALYALGTTQQELAQDKEAAATFQAFLDKFPKDKLAGECRLRLGMSLAKQKRHAEAARHFEQSAALPGFPLADFALMQQARCAAEQKQLPQAAALYESLPKKFPSSPRAGAAQLAAGKCWYEHNDFPRAETALTSSLNHKFSDAPEAAYWLGLTLVKRNKPAEAVVGSGPRHCSLSEEHFPDAIDLHAHQRPVRTTCPAQEVSALFADFARKYPKHELTPRALYMASLAALGAHDHSSSQQHAKAFLDQFPRHELTPEVLFIGGEAWLGAARPGPALAEVLFRRLLGEYPKHKHARQALLRVGLCLYLEKKYPDAINFLTRAAKDLGNPDLLAESQLLIGRCHHEAGQSAQAVAAFQKVLQTKPGWERGDEVLLALAQSLHAQKKINESIEQLKKLQTAYPKSPLQAHALYQLGEIAQEQKKDDEAVSLYEQTIARFPKSEPAALAQHAIGTIWFSKGDYTKALQAFGKLLDAHPAGSLAARARYKRALAYQQLRQFDSASKDFTQFLASKPPLKDALDARYALALCQSGLKLHAQAAATLATLIQEKPDFDRADQVYYEMGHCLLLAKKDKEAGEAFARLVAKAPNSPLAAEGWFRVGEFRESSKQYAEAATAYSSGLKKARDAGLREKLHYRLGWVQVQRGQFALAAQALLAQLDEKPKGELSADATYLAGDSLFRQDQFAKARPLFERLIQAKGKKYHDRSLYRCGACRAGLKEWSASQKCYESLIAEFPKFALLQEAKYGLGWALQNQNKLAEARAIYEQVIKATSTETAAKSRFMIGECAFRQKKYQEAVEHFLECALGYSYPEWQALGYFEAGRCFIELKDTTKAARRGWRRW